VYLKMLAEIGILIGIARVFLDAGSPIPPTNQTSYGFHVDWSAVSPTKIWGLGERVGLRGTASDK
jgi:hypothetical protein